MTSAGLKALVGLIAIMVLSVAIACGGDDDEAAPAPAPAIDTAELARVVQQAVQQAATEQVSAAEIQRLVEVAVAAGAPETATPAEIRAMVEQAVAASAQPGATAAEIEALVTKAVSESAAAIQPGVTAAEVEKLVSEALKAVPTPQVMVVTAPMAAPVSTPAPVTSVPKSGGTVNWAGFSNPPSVDLTCHTTFAGGVRGHVYDPFFAWNNDRSAALPQLVGDWSLSSDAKTYTFSVREGLIFHDGTPVTAADAVASTVRWGGSTHAIAKQVWDIINPVHDMTWEMSMGQTFGLWPIYQAFNGAWLQPASIAGVVPPEECIDPETQTIGSGPYKFIEWIPGDRVVMDRFFRYVPRLDPKDGRGGASIAYYDRIQMLVIPDASTQAAGLQTGQIHIANSVPGDFRPQLEARIAGARRAPEADAA